MDSVLEYLIASSFIISKDEGDAFRCCLAIIFIKRRDMIAINLHTAYERLREIGLVRSKREFSRNFLGRSSGYAADVIYRDVLGVRGGLSVMRYLQGRLAAVAAEVPNGLRGEIVEIITGIEASMRVVQIMASGR